MGPDSLTVAVSESRPARVRPTELQAHIDVLCAQHDIVPEWVGRGKRAWASRRQRTIRVYPIINQKRYATALHEIGHLAGGRQSGRRIEQEWGAWEYALDATLVEFTPATYRMIHRALSSYVARYTRRTRAYLPPSGDRFWSFLAAVASAASSDRTPQSPAR